MAMDVPPTLPATPTRLMDRFRAFIRSRDRAARSCPVRHTTDLK